MSLRFNQIFKTWKIIVRNMINKGLIALEYFLKNSYREEKLKTSRQNWKKKFIEKDVYMAAYKKMVKFTGNKKYENKTTEKCHFIVVYLNYLAF